MKGTSHMGKVPFMFYTNGLVFNITLVIINETTQRLKLRLSEGRTNLFALPSVSNLLHDFRHRFSITHVNMVSAFTSH